MNLTCDWLAAARLACGLWCLASPPVWAGDIYRWVDEHGKVQFGDRPPAGGNAQEIRVHDNAGTRVPDESRQARTERLLKEFETERAERAEQEAAAEREAAQRAAACEEARNRYFEYQNAGYLYEWDEHGEKRVLSDAQHRKARAEASADVDKWCD